MNKGQEKTVNKFDKFIDWKTVIQNMPYQTNINNELQKTQRLGQKRCRKTKDISFDTTGGEYM